MTVLALRSQLGLVGPAKPQVVMVVSDKAAVVAGDVLAQNRLNINNAVVAIMSDDDAEYTGSYDWVYISDSCSSTVLIAKYGAVTAPVFHGESGAWDDVGVDFSAPTTDNSTSASVVFTQAAVDLGFAAATGLTALYTAATNIPTVPVSSVGPGAIVLATQAADATLATAVLYPAGSLLLNGHVAEGRRLAWRIPAASFGTLNAAGLALWDAGVAWSTPTPPVVDTGPDGGATAGSVMTRTATETLNGATVTARAWTVQSGPAAVGTTLGTAATLPWTPSTVGSYVIRYRITTNRGVAYDDVTIVVAAADAASGVPGLLYRMRPRNLGLADGASVAALAFEVGNLTIAASGTTQPTVVANGANGQPCLRYDGVDDTLLSTGNMVGRAQPVTVAVILRQPTEVAQRQVLWNSGGVEILSDDDKPSLWAGSAEIISTAVISPTTATLVVGTFNAASSTIHVNNVQTATGNPGTAGITTATLQLGSQNNGRNFPGDVFEVLFYDHALTGTERTTLYTYHVGEYVPAVAPVVDAGVDLGGQASTVQLTRTATVDSPLPITSQGWRLRYAPIGVDVGDLSTTTALAYTPAVAGAYLFEYAATNSVGTTRDSFWALVGAGPSSSAAAPAVGARATGAQTADSLTHAITLPAGVTAGQYLGVVFSSDGASTVSISSGTNWTLVGQVAQGTNHSSTFLWKVADGNDALTLATSAVEQSTHVSFRVTGAAALAALSSTGGTTGSFDPPAVTGADGGTANRLVLTGLSVDTNPNLASAQTVTPPAGYGNLTRSDSTTTNSAFTALADATVTGATGGDPGAWAMTTGEQWVAWTILLSPTITTPVNLTTPADLQAAINAATPGQTITLGGLHVGSFDFATSGTSGAPIRYVADPANPPTLSTTTELSGFSADVLGQFLYFEGITFRNGNKGMVVDTGAAHIGVRNCVFEHTASEPFKVRNGAQYVWVRACTSRDGGNTGNGEGFYVGTASSNWSTPDVTPDANGYVVLDHCTAYDMTNDAFDIKEGSHHVKTVRCVADFANSRRHPPVGDTQGDSGFYSRGDTTQWIDCISDGGPGDGFRIYDTTVTAGVFGRGQQVKGGTANGHGGAGVGSQSDDIIVYTDFTATNCVDGRFRSDGSAGTQNPNGTPGTFAELDWSASSAMYLLVYPELAPGVNRVIERAALITETAAATSVVGNMTNSVTGDLVIVTASDGGGVPSISTGWTPLLTPTTIATTTGFGAWYRQLTGAAADTPTVSWGTSATGSIIVQPFASVDATTPLDVAVVSQNSGTTAVGSVTVPTMTTANPHALIVSGCAIAADAAAYSVAPPPGFTQARQSTGTGRRLATAVATQRTAAATGTRTWTQQSATPLPMVAYSVALRPASLAATTTVTAQVAALALDAANPATGITETLLVATWNADGQNPSTIRADIISVAAAVAALAVDAANVTITRADNITASALVAALAVDGQNPSTTRADNVSVTAGTGALAVDGQNPSTTAQSNVSADAGVAALSVDGQNPSTTTQGNTTANPTSADLTVDGQAATALITATVVAAALSVDALDAAASGQAAALVTAATATTLVDGQPATVAATSAVEAVAATAQAALDAQPISSTSTADAQPALVTVDALTPGQQTGATPITAAAAVDAVNPVYSVAANPVVADSSVDGQTASTATTASPTTADASVDAFTPSSGSARIVDPAPATASVDAQGPTTLVSQSATSTATEAAAAVDAWPPSTAVVLTGGAAAAGVDAQPATVSVSQGGQVAAQTADTTTDAQPLGWAADASRTASQADLGVAGYNPATDATHNDSVTPAVAALAVDGQLMSAQTAGATNANAATAALAVDGQPATVSTATSASVAAGTGDLGVAALDGAVSTQESATAQTADSSVAANPFTITTAPRIDPVTADAAITGDALGQLVVQPAQAALAAVDAAAPGTAVTATTLPADALVDAAASAAVGVAPGPATAAVDGQPLTPAVSASGLVTAQTGEAVVSADPAQPTTTGAIVAQSATASVDASAPGASVTQPVQAAALGLDGLPPGVEITVTPSPGSVATDVPAAGVVSAVEAQTADSVATGQLLGVEITQPMPEAALGVAAHPIGASVTPEVEPALAGIDAYKLDPALTATPAPAALTVDALATASVDTSTEPRTADLTVAAVAPSLQVTGTNAVGAQTAEATVTAHDMAPSSRSMIDAVAADLTVAAQTARTAQDIEAGTAEADVAGQTPSTAVTLPPLEPATLGVAALDATTRREALPTPLPAEAGVTAGPLSADVVQPLLPALVAVDAAALVPAGAVYAMAQAAGMVLAAFDPEQRVEVSAVVALLTMLGIRPDVVVPATRGTITEDSAARATISDARRVATHQMMDTVGAGARITEWNRG